LQNYLADQKEHACYLVSKQTQNPIPLTSITLDVKILQSVARLVMTQEYVNIEDIPVETVFLFPKDADAVITKISCEFTLKDGSKSLIETEIEGRKRAEAKYDNAVASGQTAVLGVINQSHRDLTRINIGNFPP
jgi:von Willebrand factor A domain-containing protein 5